jgi:hypothetical protein
MGDAHGAGVDEAGEGGVVDGFGGHGSHSGFFRAVNCWQHRRKSGSVAKFRVTTIGGIDPVQPRPNIRRAKVCNRAL